MLAEFPGFGAYLESIDGVNWPLWLISYILAALLIGLVLYLFYKRKNIGNWFSNLFSRAWNSL
jgi:hypothetical protein